MSGGKILGLVLVIGAIGTFIFYGWAFSWEPVVDKQTIGFYIVCSLPPLGGLAGGIACLVEKECKGRTEEKEGGYQDD